MKSIFTVTPVAFAASSRIGFMSASSLPASTRRVVGGPGLAGAWEPESEPAVPRSPGEPGVPDVQAAARVTALMVSAVSTSAAP